MSTVARLDSARIDVAPAVPATCTLTVGNKGRIVEAYRFQPVGEIAPHIRVEPEQLSLFPGADGTVVVTFLVPRDPAVTAGEVPFAIVVHPQEQVEATVVPEAVAVIAEYDEVTAELTPLTAPARLGARFVMVLDNRGNHPVAVAVTGQDPNGVLRFRCRPQAFAVGPGEAVFTRVRVRPRPLMWSGQPVTLPFQLLADVDRGAQHLPLAAQVVQEPLLPRGTGKALVAAAVALLALAGLWYGVLKPTIESTAQEAVAEPVARVQMQAEAAQAQAQDAGVQAKQAEQQAEVASGMAGDAVVTANSATEGQLFAAGVTPFNRRIIVTAPPGGQSVETFTIPEDVLVTVTDLVFESRGDFGAVRLRRGADVLITAQTQDFRTLDQHFLSPIIYGAREEIVVELVCAQPLQGEDACTAGLYIGGTQRPPPEAIAPVPAPP